MGFGDGGEVGFWFSETHAEHLLLIWMTVKSEDNVPRLVSAAQTMQERVGWLDSLPCFFVAGQVHLEE